MITALVEFESARHDRVYRVLEAQFHGPHDPVSIIAAIRTALALRPSPRRIHHR